MDNDQRTPRAEAWRELHRVLNDAKAKGRWSVTALAQRSGLGRTTVSNALNGKGVSPETLASLAAPLRLDAAELLSLIRRASTADPGREPMAQGVRDSVAANAAPLGKSIRLLDPFALEVHHSISMDSRHENEHPTLTDYVLRSHDRLLAETMNKAVCGVSQISLLVGASSTGKTRACYEAVQSLPDHWLLWHPIDPDRPEAALRDLRSVRPCTVVWLNEAQHYLLSPRYGEKIASGIRTLLTDDSRGPVLVLGTIWPEYFEQLMREPRPKEPDIHAQARSLLTGRSIAVPNRFDPPAVDAMRSSTDPVLAMAAARAEDGMVAQYLAGAPELVLRFNSAAPGVRALIEAAMDARRLGHPWTLPLSFLASAAEGYLTDTEWDLLPNNWLEQALVSVSEPIRGARGALFPIRRPRGSDPRDVFLPAYRLADFLEQLGRERHGVVPELFWAAAVAHCRGAGAAELARQAASRSLMEVAHQLAVAAGDSASLVDTAERLCAAGRLQEALSWFQQAADCGDEYAYSIAANHLDQAGYSEEAQLWFRKAGVHSVSERPKRIEVTLRKLERAAQAGNPLALREAGSLLVTAGRLDDALHWFAREGDALTLHIAAWHLEGHGRLDEALDWYQRSSDAGHPKALLHAACALVSQDRRAEAWNWIERAAIKDGPQVFREAANSAFHEGDLDKGLRWYLRGGELGDVLAFLVAGDRLARAGRVPESFGWYQKASEKGCQRAPDLGGSIDPDSVDDKDLDNMPDRISAAFCDAIARHLRAVGRTNEALKFSGRAAEAGRTVGYLESANDLASQGFFWEAVTWYEKAHAAGYPEALLRAAETLSLAGQSAEAMPYYWRASAAGQPEALRLAAGHTADQGQWTQALELYRKAAESGDLGAYSAAGHQLVRAGRLEEGLRWFGLAAMREDAGALRQAGEYLAQAGRVAEAVQHFEQAAALGDRAATHSAIQALRGAEKERKAEQLHRYGWAAGGGIAKPWKS
ncbi:helix-turn-helix domain-containing protein [Streptomyces sp. NPDC102264]|uniref:helix-turn-helix domain-containing protein n=1 Tax=Streptomyces sp. NPDC102264 TaxID=3366149 RepID=UPI0037FA9158